MIDKPQALVTYPGGACGEWLAIQIGKHDKYYVEETEGIEIGNEVLIDARYLEVSKASKHRSKSAHQEAKAKSAAMKRASMVVKHTELEV